MQRVRACTTRIAQSPFDWNLPSQVDMCYTLRVIAICTMIAQSSLDWNWPSKRVLQEAASLLIRFCLKWLWRGGGWASILKDVALSILYRFRLKGPRTEIIRVAKPRHGPMRKEDGTLEARAVSRCLGRAPLLQQFG
jgi:hypothetical protein